MTATNVWVTITNPDRLMAGESALADFEAAKIQLFRYATETAARADTGATLVTTWSLVASNEQLTDDAGPYRYGYYDDAQVSTSWYRYRFADDAVLQFGQLSDPWQAESAPAWALRDVLFEVGHKLGKSVEKVVAEANTDASCITATNPFKSTLVDSNFWDMRWVIVSEDAGGAAAAPEGEELLIASVDTATGVVTLERDASAAITTGDVVLVSSYMRPTDIVRCINEAREEMQVTVTQDIALANSENRYPAPRGVRSKSDIYDCVGVVAGGTGSNRETEFQLDFDIEFDGVRSWLVLTDYPGTTRVARVRYLLSYRDLEGDLSAMSDTTSAPIEWLRPAAAYKCAAALVDSDPDVVEFARLLGSLQGDAERASHRYAPDIMRRVKTGPGLHSLPGPRGVL
ncbi:MAG: hypothetical protein RLZZ200_681 [Pseudomonadota bacterium]|jgi:hypothetical protein